MVLTAACLNEGSKTSISRSHEMKGKIVDVHPVALPQQEKNRRLLTQKTVSERDRAREAERHKTLRREMRREKYE